MQQGKSGILAQNPATLERKLRLRWILGASAIPLFGIITAFGIAPQTSDQPVAMSTVIEEVIRPGDLQTSNVADADIQPIWQADQIQRDDTLSNVLQRLNIRNSVAIDFLRQSPEASALPSQLRPGRNIISKTTGDGDLLELLYQTGADTALQVKLTDHGYVAEQVQVTLDTQTTIKSGEIRSSLFAATDNAGIPDHIAIQLADIFSSDIDFNLDLRKGDRFSVVYESSYHNGELIKSGRVLSAEFVNQGKHYRAVLYRDHEGHTNYYTPEGKSLHQAFLRSPLEFSRISSGFTLARFHPILQTWRAHKGVDYAAPIGTNIKATSNGTVDFVGTQRGYGNVIMLQHAGGISTVYGHLSHFANGLHKGQHVSQGDVIGQVGMSGMATGPHLHYEFRVHGEHRDPLKVALPMVASLLNSELPAFRSQSSRLLAPLALLRDSNTVSID
jgi:murein DD-endopeptidase MepM/ murein hydrolase activator NlpD